MSRDWIVIGLAILRGIALPIVLVISPLLVQRIPVRVKSMIAGFIDLVLQVLLFILEVVLPTNIRK